jgi:adenine-specific DNA-methyltransferase
MTQAGTAHKQRERFIQLLRELFQLNQPDLDFGLYRIMHAKSAEIEAFLTDDLLAVIAATFGGSAQVAIDTARASYERELATARDYGVTDPEASPKVQQARSAYEVARDSAGDDADIYDHLYRFFERYYDQGDFMSRRYYARETNDRAAPYSVPYDGSEVYLHWANKDQYYIKTSESFNNYSIDISKAADSNGALFAASGEAAPRKLHFKLVEAEEGEHNNVKATADKDRFFLLDAVPIAWQAGEDGASELVVRFQYCVDPDKTGNASTWRDKRNAQAVMVILAALQEQAQSSDAPEGDAAAFHLVLAQLVAKGTKKAGGKQETQTLLAKYLYQYTAKNTMDYFIHKDLGGFLKRELDFYIKNEVMRLDDLGTASAPHVANYEKYLVKLHTLRAIAQKLIGFLAQIEDFQKKLWLKKRFVIETNYCLTIDRIPEKFYAEIAANDEQRQEWVRLFAIDEVQQDTATVGYSVPVTIDFLTANKFLVLDTKHFSSEFIARLINEFEGVADSLGGTIIHSENFNALNLLEGRYKNGIKLVLTDPPYNTKTDVFPYKDSYKHSSWLTMMGNRMEKAKILLREDGALFHHIDENEHQNATLLLTEVFGSSNRVVDIVWKNSSKNGESFISMQHEYIVGATKNAVVNKGVWLERKEGLEEIYKAFDGFRRKHGTDWKAIHQAALDFYNSFPDSNPIKDSSHYSWMDQKGIYFAGDISKPANGYYYELEHPHTKRPCKKPAGGWRFVEETMLDKVSKNEIHFGIDETTIPNNKVYLNESENQGLTSIKYRDGRVASNLLKDMFGEKDPFKNPKDVELTARLLKALNTENEVVLDYFAGSGTTIHAILELERAGQKRKYEAIEMGDHFDNVLIPRVKKAIYSVDWKDGTPVSRKGISHAFKYVRLESYEDTLNNLQLADAGQRQQATAANPQLREDYFLNYLLALETEGSPSLLNVATFADPTAYRLDVKRPGSDAHASRTVDLVETFNWLIGLRVDKLHAPQTFAAELEHETDEDLPAGSATRLLVKGKLKEVAVSAENASWWFRSVEGRVPGVAGSLIEQRVLVVWRKLSGNLEQDNAVLDAYLREVLRLDLSSSEDKNQFDVIYVNGSHTLPKLPHCDIRLLEQTFHQRMWESQDV